MTGHLVIIGGTGWFASAAVPADHKGGVYIEMAGGPEIRIIFPAGVVRPR
jgi:hypothetical protein